MKKKRGLINSMGELSELPCWLRWKMNLARIIILKKMIKKRKVMSWDLKRIQERVFSDYGVTYDMRTVFVARNKRIVGDGGEILMG